jgi:hypothetical protein
MLGDNDKERSPLPQHLVALLQDQLDEPRVGVRSGELNGARGGRHALEVDHGSLSLAHRLVRDHDDVVVTQ